MDVVDNLGLFGTISAFAWRDCVKSEWHVGFLHLNFNQVPHE